MRNDTVIDAAKKELEALYGNDASGISYGLKHMNGNEDLPIPKNLVNILSLAQKEMDDIVNKMSESNQKNIIKVAMGTAAISITATLSVTLFTVHAIYKIRKEKQLNREKIEQVINILKQDVSLSNEEKLSEDKNDIIADDVATSDTQTEAPELFPSVE